MVLRTSEYEVFTANDGIEALEVLSRSTPDLIISDIMMPNMDGVQLVQKLRGDEKYKLLPIMILTVIEDSEKEYELLSLGADEYCEKTVQRKILLRRIENLLKRGK